MLALRYNTYYCGESRYSSKSHKLFCLGSIPSPATRFIKRTIMPICTQDQIYSSMGHAKTRNLILEFSSSAEVRAKTIFSVSDNPHPEKIPLKTLYMSLVVDDPTEVAFAEEVFGSVSFWENLCNLTLFKPYLERWRKEADLRRKKKAFQAIIETATSKEVSATRLSAAKYLIDEPWKTGDRKARKESKQTTQEAFETYKSDVERLKEEGIIN